MLIIIVVHRLLAGLGNFLFLCPAESSIGNLLSALDIKGTLDTLKKEKVIVSSKVLGLARDINEMVEQSSADQ